jgi:Fe-S-cluster containining protein
MNPKQKAEQIAAKARNSISEFCMNECEAYCCRKGYIIINEYQLNLIATKEKKELLLKEEKIKELFVSGKFLVDFSNSLGGCPALDGTKCTIHKNPNRPNACKEFPIFIYGNQIKISPKCPAHQNNKFYPYIKEFEKLGFELS